MTIEDAIAIIPMDSDGHHWRWTLSHPGYEDGVYLDGRAKAVIYHPASSGGPPRFIGIADAPAEALEQAARKAQQFAADYANV